jgi:hypothetical protein
MSKQNIICTEGHSLCSICMRAEFLENDEPCEFDSQKTNEGCPGFICNEQCRLCPSDCEFLGKGVIWKC